MEDTANLLLEGDLSIINVYCSTILELVQVLLLLNRPCWASCICCIHFCSDILGVGLLCVCVRECVYMLFQSV